MANMEQVAQLADSIVQATAALHNPGSSQQQRSEAVQFFEQVGMAAAACFFCCCSRSRT